VPPRPTAQRQQRGRFGSLDENESQGARQGPAKPRAQQQLQQSQQPLPQDPPMIMAAAAAAAAQAMSLQQQQQLQQMQTLQAMQMQAMQQATQSQQQQQQQSLLQQQQQLLAQQRESKDADDGQGAGKGVISLLQEFVQCSRQFHAPQHRPILQWSYDNRMADFTTLEFRGTVAFLLDGVPHHVAGAWHPSKKLAQRDAAERALGFFVGRWGEQLLLEQEGCIAKPPQVGESRSEMDILEGFSMSYPACNGQSPQWSHSWEGEDCRAQVEISLLGVPHKFAGCPKTSQQAASTDAARRVLWYLQCPGFETIFAPDPRAPAVTGKEIPSPPANWASDAAEGCALQLAERKTALMRVQNRLQQAFARRLRPGQSVWDWSYEQDEEDTQWPPLCRATVTVPVAGRSFTGEWARGQRDAQIEACNLVSAFLNDGGLTRTPSRGSSGELLDREESGDCEDHFDLVRHAESAGRREL